MELRSTGSVSSAPASLSETSPRTSHLEMEWLVTYTLLLVNLVRLSYLDSAPIERNTLVKIAILVGQMCMSMEPEELLASDQQILDALAEGRCTPAFLVDSTGFSKPTIHSRLNVLVAAGHVEKVHPSGLYELVDDPREE